MHARDRGEAGWQVGRARTASALLSTPARMGSQEKDRCQARSRAGTAAVQAVRPKLHPVRQEPERGERHRPPRAQLRLRVPRAVTRTRERSSSPRQPRRSQRWRGRAASREATVNASCARREDVNGAASAGPGATVPSYRRNRAGGSQVLAQDERHDGHLWVRADHAVGDTGGAPADAPRPQCVGSTLVPPTSPARAFCPHAWREERAGVTEGWHARHGPHEQLKSPVNDDMRPK